MIPYSSQKYQIQIGQTFDSNFHPFHPIFFHRWRWINRTIYQKNEAPILVHHIPIDHLIIIPSLPIILLGSNKRPFGVFLKWGYPQIIHCIENPIAGAVFKIPLSFNDTAWLRTGVPYWIILPNILASIIPQLIINQQGFSSQCSINATCHVSADPGRRKGERARE